MTGSLISGEPAVASDSIPPLSRPGDVGASSFTQPEEIQEVGILPRLMALSSRRVVLEEQLAREPEAPVFADVYFDERRLFIDARLKTFLLKTVTRLNQESEWRLQIEGYCDPRGTSAYNLARANFHLAAFVRYLQILGVPSHQIATMNFGQNPVACRARSERCQEDNLRAQHIFSILAVGHTQRGCLTRLRLVPGHDWPRTSPALPYLPYLQRIQMASSSSSF